MTSRQWIDAGTSPAVSSLVMSSSLVCRSGELGDTQVTPFCSFFSFPHVPLLSAGLVNSMAEKGAPGEDIVIAMK